MPTDQPKDLDLTYLLRVLRRAALPLLAAALLLAGLTYLLSGSRPAVYEATASLAALPTGSGNSVIVQTLVTAPPLPPAVVERALRSPAVWQGALRDLSGRTPPSAARSQLLAALRAEAASGESRYVRLTPEVNQEFVGVYEIAVRAPTPALAQAGAEVLLVPAAFTRPTGEAHWEVLLRARAIENLACVVGVNRVGTDGNGIAYRGDSAALDPLGQPLVEGDAGERVLEAVLSAEQLRGHRERFPAQLDADDFVLRD